ncbi:MAG: ribosome biogenesis GTPase YlqF [Deltaproteobacteria bacterium]|nr:ribosome biogenesis GTPase YlqF [Deltaproteobacteria bacterium]|tara:strand:+ start:1651 stop:2556 length:906 start_codon:yes stop_codon:yes gene_type:complete
MTSPSVLEKSMNQQKINWYPGHMLKAKKDLAGQLKRVDVVLEIRDARIPISSINKDFEEILRHKKRILIFNKTALADHLVTREWEESYRKKDIPFLFIDAMSKSHMQKILPLSRKIMQQKWTSFRRRGIRPPTLKMLICGIPNVGKSSLINRLSGRKATETGPTPGVTKHQDWIKLGNDVELLDTPGILWPKIEDYDTGLRLGLTGAIKDSIVGTSQLSIYLIKILKQKLPVNLQTFYQLTSEDLNLFPEDILHKIAENRGCLKRGGALDESRVENLILRDFRQGKLGRLSFDYPNAANEL